MFEPNTVSLKSGEGKNYFEAEVSIPSALDEAQAKVIMGELRQMQKDRMEWASRTEMPLGQSPIASR